MTYRIVKYIIQLKDFDIENVSPYPYKYKGCDITQPFLNRIEQACSKAYYSISKLRERLEKAHSNILNEYSSQINNNKTNRIKS